MSSSDTERVNMSNSKINQRRLAWHRAGNSVEKCVTAQEAIKQGNLDFTVKVTEQPVQSVVDGVTINAENKFMTYAINSDNSYSYLGVVGNRYTPIQNQYAFDLLDNIVDESGAKYDYAGRDGNGERCWISMKMPETIKVANGTDAIETYLTCVNSHDGSSSFRIYVTFLRLICKNGMKGFSKGSEISLRHTANSSMKVGEARLALNLVFQEQKQFELEINRMLGTKMSNSEYRQFVHTLVPDAKPDATERQVNSIERVRGELLNLWTAPTQQPVANTAWAAYNAVVEYVDWFKVRRNDSLNTSRIVGESKMKNRAFDLLSA